MNQDVRDRLEKSAILIFILAFVWVFFFSCKTGETYTNRVDSVFVQRLIPITLPVDSSALKALLACNEKGREAGYDFCKFG